MNEEYVYLVTITELTAETMPQQHREVKMVYENLDTAFNYIHAITGVRKGKLEDKFEFGYLSVCYENERMEKSVVSIEKTLMVRG